MAKSEKMNVYFISGLGADRRAFERLRLSEKFAIHHLDWIAPNENETLDDYAKRLAISIDTSQPYAIVGLSMGGMIASAMTKFLQPHKTILISSVGCNAEFPPLLRFARVSRIYKLIPEFIFRPQYVLPFHRMFGGNGHGQRMLMRYFLSQADPKFMKWAIGSIVTWSNCDRPKTIFHIHGDNDWILPLKYTKPDVIIAKGSHFMVWTKAGQVSKILEQALA